MKNFLFRFGFCTPLQWCQNQTNGWDDESSAAIFINAQTKELAENWGREIAEVFCERLFRLSSWPDAIPSWKAANFAHWIEEDLANLPSDYIQTIPLVPYGDFPDFSTWPQRG